MSLSSSSSKAAQLLLLRHYFYHRRCATIGRGSTIIKAASYYSSSSSFVIGNQLPKRNSHRFSSSSSFFFSPIKLNLQSKSCHRGMVTVTQTKATESTTTPEEEDSIPKVTITTSSPSKSSSSSSEEVIITSAAAKQIKHLSTIRSEPDLYLRLYVDAGGCSGFQYKFNLESNDPSSPSYNTDEGGIDPDDDVVLEKEGVKVVVDRGSLDYVRGSTVDYVQEMIKSSFEVRENPNSENACGCGSSFAMKKFSENPALD